FHYEITTWSPELRKPMTWLEHDRAGLQALFTTLPKHNSDASLLSRHATVYTVTTSEDERSAEVVSALQVFRTTLDGGASARFAGGKFHDTLTFEGGTPRLRRREVRLDTRMLGFGHHIPF